MAVTLRKLFLVFLPLTDNEGAPFAKSEFIEVSHTLTTKFGGMTRMRTEREISFVGEWLDPQTGKLYQDDVIQCWIIAEISAETDAFFTELKELLKARFRQEEILIMAHTVEIF